MAGLGATTRGPRPMPIDIATSTFLAALVFALGSWAFATR